jgi:exopolyphosphatase / guanosine-5'-triphosphate,3'-diphosphate pyrophosphatase
VRLVVYSGSQRAPRTWLNEKVMARLGKDLSATGRMPDKAIEHALAALARHVTILADLGIDDVQTVATAAVRDAENGPEFLASVRALGLSPRLLSGEEEAQGGGSGIGVRRDRRVSRRAGHGRRPWRWQPGADHGRA